MAADKAIIISTHILEEVEAVCSRAIVINKGKIVADGTADDLMQRMHYHGAVSLKVVADRADAAILALSSASSVARVETLGKPNGHLLLRAIPRQKTMSASEVAALLRAKNIPVDELYVERGRLDDVFRQITMPDDGGNDA
jgi:ABC-2 type transport system ATP-binding protein